MEEKKRSSVIIRNAKEEEIDEIKRVEDEAWPEGLRFEKKHFRSHFKVFPRGFFAAYVNDVMVGTTISEILKYDLDSPIKSWEEATDDGFIKGIHDPDGNALYVVSLGVSDKYRGYGIGSLLIQRQIELTKELDLDYLVLGARVPFFHKYPKMDVEEYVNKRNENGERFDSELRFYERNRLEVIKIMPNYMTAWDDKESRNYGVLMVWWNKNKKESYNT